MSDATERQEALTAYIAIPLIIVAILLVTIGGVFDGSTAAKVAFVIVVPSVIANMIALGVKHGRS